MPQTQFIHHINSQRINRTEPKGDGNLATRSRKVLLGWVNDTINWAENPAKTPAVKVTNVHQDLAQGTGRTAVNDPCNSNTGGNQELTVKTVDGQLS
jgi:hypothetical protein